MDKGFTHGNPHEGQNGYFPPPGTWTKKEKFLENVKSAVPLRLVGLILAMAVFLPI